MALIGPGGRPVTSAARAERGQRQPARISRIPGLATFAADVLEASRDVPVIVDFWAPWCGPCKTLGPALEAAVNAADGAVKLVKVNIDENPEIAQQLRIQSIPTVYAFKNGQPVDGFMGAIPESQIKAFVAALAGGEHGHDHEHAMAARNTPPKCWRWRPRPWRRAISPWRPRPMAMCCRTSPAIPRRWRAWRALSQERRSGAGQATLQWCGPTAPRTKPSAPWKPN